MEYITRPLGKTILSTTSSVIVIEGARAVGKTMLMQKELEPQGFSYYSLADDSTYQQAKTDISTWVNSLPRPAIIDEAQRIESLPLAIKEAADRADSSIPQFVLTGSASLNRKGLGGQNPLTRRACNFELHPFTQREIRRASSSIVDIFWDAQPNMEFQSAVTEQELQNLLSVGGFPRYALSQRRMTSADRSRLIKSDIENTLGDALLPDEKIDFSIANAILNSLFALPGNILNVSRMASELERETGEPSSGISTFSNVDSLFDVCLTLLCKPISRRNRGRRFTRSTPRFPLRSSSEQERISLEKTAPCSAASLNRTSSAKSRPKRNGRNAIPTYSTGANLAKIPRKLTWYCSVIISSLESR